MSEMRLFENVDKGVSSYIGTPWECVAFLDSYFDAQRAFVQTCVDSGDDETWHNLQEDYERLVYQVTVSPIRTVAKRETRPETEARVMRMKTALEVYDAIANNSVEKTSQDGA